MRSLERSASGFGRRYPLGWQITRRPTISTLDGVIRRSVSETRAISVRKLETSHLDLAQLPRLKEQPRAALLHFSCGEQLFGLKSVVAT